MEESLVKRASKSISQGVGVRATAGEKTGYAYSDEISVRQLEQAADTARYIARSPAGEGQVPAISVGRPSRDLYPVGQPATEVATKEKVTLLQKSMRWPGPTNLALKMSLRPSRRNIKWRWSRTLRESL